MPEDCVVVHSLNESGRKNILSLLPNAIDAPGAWATLKLKDKE